MRHYLSVDDLSTAELPDLLDLAATLKSDRAAHTQALAGHSVALIFEKPSTRTRVSFEVGVEQLGAHAVVLSSSELQLGRGETIQDTGRVLSRYVDAIVLFRDNLRGAQTAGYYDDVVVRTGDGWKIARRRTGRRASTHAMPSRRPLRFMAPCSPTSPPSKPIRNRST